MSFSKRSFFKNRDDISSSDSEANSPKNLQKYELLNTSAFRRANLDRPKSNSVLGLNTNSKFFIKISKEYQKSRESINQVFDQVVKKKESNNGGHRSDKEVNMVHKTKVVGKHAGINGSTVPSESCTSRTTNSPLVKTGPSEMGQTINKKSTLVLKNKTTVKPKDKNTPAPNGITSKIIDPKDSSSKETSKCLPDEYSVEIPNFDELINNSAKREKLKILENSSLLKGSSSLFGGDLKSSTPNDQAKFHNRSVESNACSPKTGKRIIKTKTLKQDVLTNSRLDEGTNASHGKNTFGQEPNRVQNLSKPSTCTKSHNLTPESSPETKRKLFLKKSKANSILAESGVSNKQTSTQNANSQSNDALIQAKTSVNLKSSPKLQKKSQPQPCVESSEKIGYTQMKSRSLGIRLKDNSSSNDSKSSPKVSSPNSTNQNIKSTTSTPNCSKSGGRLKSNAVSPALQSNSSKEKEMHSSVGKESDSSILNDKQHQHAKFNHSKKTLNLTEVSCTESKEESNPKTRNAERPIKTGINSEKSNKEDHKTHIQETPAFKVKPKSTEPNFIFDSTSKSNENKPNSPKLKLKLKASQISDSNKMAEEITKNIKDLDSPKLKIKTSKNLFTPVNKGESIASSNGEKGKPQNVPLENASSPKYSTISKDIKTSELNVIHDSTTSKNDLKPKKVEASNNTKKQPTGLVTNSIQDNICPTTKKDPDESLFQAEIPIISTKPDKLSSELKNLEVPSFKKSVLEINSEGNVSADKSENICASLKTKKITIKDKSIILREASLSSLIYPSQKDKRGDRSSQLSEDFLNTISKRVLKVEKTKEEDKGGSDSESSSDSSKSSRRGSRRSCGIIDYKEFAALPNWKDEFLQSAVDYAMIRIHRQPRHEARRATPVAGPVVSEISASWERRTSLEAQGPPVPGLGPVPRRTRRSAGGADRHKPLKPFLTQGSVAERVWLFECLPQPALRSRNVLLKTWRSSGSDVQNKAQFWEVSKEESPTPSSPTTKAQEKPTVILPFYFPRGTPQSRAHTRDQLDRLASVFETFSGRVLTRDHFAVVAKACGLPLFWKYPLYLAAGDGEDVPCSKFLDFWEGVVATCHDEASQFIRLLTRSPHRQYLLPEDFLPLVQDLIDTHPGLVFLKEAAEFHSRYVHTVIARIFYCVNRSWSGKISLPELRNSNFLKVIASLEEEEDINQVTQYFSYEHFYVIYCKFWELDRDHDLYISKADLRRHADGAISNCMIDRIFSKAVSRSSSKDPMMSYTEFVWFLLSEEDKRQPRSIEYWFRCMDLDGDGYLSMYELEYFYREQLQRMDVLGIEALAFDDCLCQMLDMIKPREEGKISLSDLKRCRAAPLFFDAFFNIEKFLDHEQRDPFATLRDQDPNGKEMSDWDHYAAEEYELLVAEENSSDVLEECNDSDTKERPNTSFSRGLLGKFDTNEDDVLI